MTDHLIILAGGASSRMKNSSSNVLSKNSTEQANSRSKALILINDRPMLDYVLSNAKQAGFKNIYIVVGKDDVLFKTYYGKQRSGNTFHGVTISFVYQQNRKPFYILLSSSRLSKISILPMTNTKNHFLSGCC